MNERPREAAAGNARAAEQGSAAMDEDGQVREAHSVSAGLDYPGVGPEHAFFKSTGRAEYVAVTDAEALKGFQLLSRLEGIIPALESAHAVAYLEKLAARLEPDDVVVVCLSGRGDKDVPLVLDMHARTGGNGDGP